MPDQSRNPYNLIAGVLGVVAIIAIGMYMYTHRSTPADQTATSTPIAITGTTANLIELTTSSTSGSYTVSEVPTSPKPQAPNFRIALTFGDAVSADVRTALTAQFDATVKVLAGDKTNFNGWINLGTLRKMVNDYTGAKTDWAYAATLYPKSTIPFDNLGELYLDYLKDYPKAEANFKQSISNDPHDINAYQQLVSLYTVYGYKDTATALTLIQQGLAANPDNQTLLQLQAQLRAQ
jgi:tetratricopeptide (TPR) repeat protein